MSGLIYFLNRKFYGNLADSRRKEAGEIPAHPSAIIIQQEGYMDPMIFLIIVIAAIWAIGQIMAKRLENHLKKYGMPQGLAYYHGVSGGSARQTNP